MPDVPTMKALISQHLRSTPARDEWLAWMRAFMPMLILDQEYLWDLIHQRAKLEAGNMAMHGDDHFRPLVALLRELDLGFRLGRTWPVPADEWAGRTLKPPLGRPSSA